MFGSHWRGGGGVVGLPCHPDGGGGGGAAGAGAAAGAGGGGVVGVPCQAEGGAGGGGGADIEGGASSTFVPETQQEFEARRAGAELWAEVTIPRKGPPRPIRLALKSAKGFEVIEGK